MWRYRCGYIGVDCAPKTPVQPQDIIQLTFLQSTAMALLRLTYILEESGGGSEVKGRSPASVLEGERIAPGAISWEDGRDADASASGPRHSNSRNIWLMLRS